MPFRITGGVYSRAHIKGLQLSYKLSGALFCIEFAGSF